MHQNRKGDEEAGLEEKTRGNRLSKTNNRNQHEKKQQRVASMTSRGRGRKKREGEKEEVLGKVTSEE